MANVGLSKSKYVTYTECPKCLWLDKYKPELAEIDEGAKERMAVGNEIGDLAMGLFGSSYISVEARKGDVLDIPKMIERTQEELKKGTKVICEASFSYNNCFCAVDILKKEKGGYAIYEVKSSTEVKDYHIVDVSYQKYVLEHCNIKIVGTYVVTLNNTYVRKGKLDIKKLFKINDVEKDVKKLEKNIEENVNGALNILKLKTEPKQDMTKNCKGCGYWKYCSKNVPKVSVFDIYIVRFSTALKLYEKGIKTFQDLIDNNVKLNDIQKRQVDFYVNNRKDIYVNKAKVKAFLKTLSYPLYFLDFETMQMPIPEYDGIRPYQMQPFQYSLHYIEKKGGELKHKEFLAESGKNPLKDIAESLCKDIPMDVCVTAYNKQFECGRIEELSEMFPKLKKHLLNIKDNMRDFWDPFKGGAVYNKAMGGSFSIKSVLPALFPKDPKLDYHNLPGDVHNGGDASSIFPKIKDMPKKEQEKARKDLLEYCGLDTYAMVKVWEKLIELSK